MNHYSTRPKNSYTRCQGLYPANVHIHILINFLIFEGACKPITLTWHFSCGTLPLWFIQSSRFINYGVFVWTKYFLATMWKFCLGIDGCISTCLHPFIALWYIIYYICKIHLVLEMHVSRYQLEDTNNEIIWVRFLFFLYLAY